MGWTEELASGVRAALERGGPQRIAVHTRDQAELGQIAARRMGSNLAEDGDTLSFEVVPEHIPLGSILA